MVSLKFILSWLTIETVAGQQQYLDRFNYNGTVQRSDGFHDYGPPDWGSINCDAINHLDECIAYIDKWEEGQDWSITQDYCRWCPDDGTESCGLHHESPINLLRSHADPNSTDYNFCVDVHWMKYEDSFCTLDQLIAGNAFQIERHALRIAQPITILNATNRTYQLECPKPGIGRHLGRIDFSKGFSQWWYLSHIDFSTPSEHTQNGKRYDVEAKMMHFYSVNGTATPYNGQDNQLAAVTVFMEAYDDVPPYPFLDLAICQWRTTENTIRKECGLSPIATPYPGCFPNARERNLRQEKEEEDSARRRRDQDFHTIYDIIIHNALNEDDPNATLASFAMDDGNWRPPEDKDWDAWIEEQSNRMKFEDAAYHHAKASTDSEEDLEHEYRKLIAGAGLEWFNYFLMLGVRTEYYFRYSGSQTIPPCYGKFNPISRSGVDNYRVLKDPIRIHPRQLAELKRLMRDRIAPLGDPVASCQPDTAATVTSDGEVYAARPLQYESTVHYEMFCECTNWPSKWPDDREWCAKYTNLTERLYENPYNFLTNGF